jgi:hypothetical protein
MSEHAPHHETAHTPEAAAVEQRPRHATKPEQRAETAAEAARSLEAIRKQINEQSRTKQEAAQSGTEQPVAPTPAFVTRHLKLVTRTRLLKQVRQHLPLPEKAFSRVIHQPIVDSISETAGKTIARPSGLLSGGIFAFIGSGTFLYIAKHYGYRYNFFLWAMFFVGGFIVGLLIEGLLILVDRKRS